VPTGRTKVDALGDHTKTAWHAHQHRLNIGSSATCSLPGAWHRSTSCVHELVERLPVDAAELPRCWRRREGDAARGCTFTETPPPCSAFSAIIRTRTTPVLRETEQRRLRRSA